MPTTTIPISEHKKRGTFRAARHANKSEVTNATPLGPAPQWFNEVQRAEWDRLASIEGIFDIYRATVEHACVLYDRFVADAKGERTMLASERQTYHSIYMQLCLTRGTEAKALAIPAKSTEDPWAK